MLSKFTMNKLINYIEEYDSIVIFRHINPDGDALGSQFGLYTYIKDNYPKKNIYVVGSRKEGLSYYPFIESKPSSDILSKSLAIILDSATEARIDGPYDQCKFVFNIDHHPSDDPYGDDYFVRDTCSSTCEIVANLVLETNHISQEAASYLLSGMMTDTNRFTTENTKSDTLRTAADLMDKGANITELNYHFFNKRYEDFNYERKFADIVEFHPSGLAILLIPRAYREKLKLNARDAKAYALVMYDVKDFKINVVYAEEDDGTYIGSLRSKDITINDIAAEYRGGGHRLAAGFTAYNLKEVNEINQKLINKLESNIE